MRRIAVICFKGGVGKTTTAVSVAAGLARRGRRVLLVDADSQANATWILLGGRGAEPPTLADVLMRRCDAEDAIRPTRLDNLALLPAEAALGGVNVALALELGRDTRLRSALASVDGAYDFVILDTGPTFTTLLANALVYAAEVFVPADPGIFAMLGLVELEATLGEVREAYGNDELHLAGLVLARVARSNVARDVEAGLRERFGDRVFRSVVPMSTKVEEAHSRGLTVLEYAPKSPAAVAYEALVGEIIGDGERVTKGWRGPASRRGPGAGEAA